MLGALIGAASSLAGGLMNSRQADKQAKLQKEFAQNGIQWKAADAEKAGISKLYALGANTASYSPISTGSSLGDSIGQAGQDVGRAIQATESPAGKVGSFGRAAQALQLESLQLDNNLKRAKLASEVRLATQPGTPPGAPAFGTTYGIPGQPQTDRTFSTKTDVADPNDPGMVPGTTPEVMLARSVKGGYIPTLPPAMQEALESQGWLAQMQYAIRNNILPFVDQERRPKFLRQGSKDAGLGLSFNPVTGEYMTRRHRNKARYKVRSKGTY